MAGTVASELILLGSLNAVTAVLRLLSPILSSPSRLTTPYFMINVPIYLFFHLLSTSPDRRWTTHYGYFFFLSICALMRDVSLLVGTMRRNAEFVCSLELPSGLAEPRNRSEECAFETICFVPPYETSYLWMYLLHTYLRRHFLERRPRGAALLPITSDFCTDELVVAGPYRYLRNPVAVSAFIYPFFAYVVVKRSKLATIYLVVAFGLVSAWIKYFEEADLKRRFGRRYHYYCLHVPRWIPLLSPYEEPQRNPNEAYD